MLHCLEIYLTHVSAFTDAAVPWLHGWRVLSNTTGWSDLLTAKVVADITSLLQKQPSSIQQPAEKNAGGLR